MDLRISLVTVVFETEIPLLSLQARSMAKFLAIEEFDAILIIDNTHSGLRPRRRSKLLHEYGPWRSKVRFLRPNDITHLVGARGWIGQQVLKLMVHEHVDTPFYLVLDAKNHWVRGTGREEFINADGRARGGRHSYRQHPLRTSLEHVLQYLDVDAEAWLDDFPVTHTPVVLSTEITRQLTADIAERAGRPFADEFVAADLTEFFLYAGWIIATFGDLDGHLDGNVVRSATVWPRTARADGFARALAEVRELDPPFMAIHRTALARADFYASQRLADFWVERGLFTRRREVATFIAAYKVHYLLTMSVRKARTKLHLK